VVYAKQTKRVVGYGIWNRIRRAWAKMVIYVKRKKPKTLEDIMVINF
jgi:hypothetical protein